ncbi:MAG: hypothetical protein KJ568_01190 [Actinobacteria bacterium]|nr:hypothetical protein [Actinomycetota bacterium]
MAERLKKGQSGQAGTILTMGRIKLIKSSGKSLLTERGRSLLSLTSRDGL